jgi:single-stranded-DNA-specific exonuclease
MKAARISPGRITATSIGFIIGPRLNAAGRLGSADRALRLLTTSDQSDARDLASELHKENRKRQELTVKAEEKVLEIAREGPEDPILVFAADESFHEGVVGLAAARLRERFYRPAFVATLGEESTRGSARSIPGFHVTEALDECADLLSRHGGHERAGGFTLRNANLEEFRDRLWAIAERELKDIELIPELEIDAEVDLPHLGEDLLEFIDKLEPCGEGNRAPVLMAKNVTVMGKRTVGADGRHLKLTVKQGGRAIDAIAFRMGDRVSEISERIDVAFNFESNEYMGIRSLQLNVLDIRRASI